MIAFFELIAVVGIIWVVLEFAAKANSAAPSMYRTTGNGWLLVIVGVIGAVCVAFLR